MSVKNIPVPYQGFDDHDSFSLEPQYGTLFRNVRSNRRRITRSPGGTLMAPSPVPSGINSSIVQGLLQSPLTAGSVTYNHTLAVSPKAFIFTGGADVSVSTPSGIRVSSIQPNYETFIAFSDGTTETAHSHTTKNGVASGVSWHAYANFAVFLIDSSGNILLSAAVTAASSTTFTLNWTVVDTVSHDVSYTLIGGTAVSAKVVEWQANIVNGNQSVTGVGFLPQIVFQLPGSNVKIPVEANMVSLGFGAMTASDQFALDSHSIDATSPLVTERVISRNHVIALLVGTAGVPPPAVAFSARYVSLDADGFTVNWDEHPGTHIYIGSLCLAGLAGANVGIITKTTASAPASQSVTGVGFTPSWVFLGGVNDTTTAAALGIRRSHGSSDGTNSYCWTEIAKSGVSPSVVEETHSSSAIFSLWNPTSPATQFQTATLQSMDTDGFTLSWPTNDTTAALIAYVALGGSISGNVGVIRNYYQPYVGTGVTVAEKLLMLTSKSAFIYVPSTSSTGTWASTGETYTGTDTERFSIVNTQSIAAWSQGVDVIRQWDGTTFSNLVTVGQNHAARALIAFADRIVSIRPFFSGIDHQTQIRWCISGNVNDWSGTGSGALEIIETSQDPLVTGFVLGDRAYLAKQRELIELIWTGTNSPTFGTAPRVSGMGILAPHSVGLGEQFAFWLGPDDIYMWDGSTLTPVGDRAYNTIDALIDYNNLDMIQGAVYTPDSLYLLVVPPFLFVYDYRRDIWYQDDTTNFEAIHVFKVGSNFTADIDHSEFQVIGDSFVQTVRLDQTLTDYLGAPIDSYWTTKDYTAEELRGGGTQGFTVSLWNINSLREVRFQSNAGDIVEVGVSTDRGVTWQTTFATTNVNGVGVAWFQVPFSQIRFRFRDYGTDAYEIHGSWGVDFEDSGYLYPG